ncbi:MAG: type I 3-dehydroquinate dehydratase [Bacteroidota bacterium]
MRQINNALLSDVELVELRVDLIKEDPRAIFAQISRNVKTIVTCRPGEYNEEERIEILKTSMDLGASFIDIEIESAEESLVELVTHAKGCNTEIIVSYHDFEQTPHREALGQLMNRCFERGGGIAKIATKVNSSDDIRNLISLYDRPGRKVVLGMGTMGRITRIIAPYLGSEFTFASPGEGGETAPGQLSLSQLNELYKVINES